MAGPRLGRRVEAGETEPARPRDCETCEFCGAAFPGRAGLRAHRDHRDSPCRRQGRLQSGKVRKRLRDTEEADSGISMEEEERPQPPAPPALRIKINLAKKRVLSIDSSEDPEPTTKQLTSDNLAMVRIKQELLSEIEVKVEPGVTCRSPSLASLPGLPSLAPGIRVSLERMADSTYSVALSSSVPQDDTTKQNPKIGTQSITRDSSVPHTRPKGIEHMPGNRSPVEKSTTEKSGRKRGRPSKEEIKSLLKETLFGETMEGSGKEEYEPIMKKSQFKKVDTLASAKSMRKSETPDKLSASPRSQPIKLTENTIKSKASSRPKSMSIKPNKAPSKTFTDKAHKRVQRSTSLVAWQTSASKVDPRKTEIAKKTGHHRVKPKHRPISNTKATARCSGGPLCPAIGPHLCTFPPLKAKAGGRSVVEGSLAPCLPASLASAWVAFNYSFLHSHRAVFCYRVTPDHKVDILCRTTGQTQLWFRIVWSGPGPAGPEDWAVDGPEGGAVDGPEGGAVERWSMDGPADKILVVGPGAADLFRAKLIRYNISVLT